MVYKISHFVLFALILHNFADAISVSNEYFEQTNDLESLSRVIRSHRCRPCAKKWEARCMKDSEECPELIRLEEKNYKKKMFTHEPHKCFQIDCSNTERPQPTLIRRIHFKQFVEKRFLKENRTTSRTKLPSYIGELENRSRQNQNIATMTRTVHVTNTRAVTISKTIGSSSRREDSTSTTNEAFEQVSLGINHEQTNQNTNTSMIDFSEQFSNTQNSERGTHDTLTHGWEVGVVSGFNAFGLAKAELHGSYTGSSSKTTMTSESDSNTRANTSSVSNSNADMNSRTVGDSETKLNHNSKTVSNSATNARITESSTNDADTVTESVDETLTFASQEFNVMYESKLEYKIDIFEHKVINDYHLDFEIDVDVETQAFEFQRKEGVCVVSTTNGDSLPLRYFLFIKQRFDGECGNYFKSSGNDDIIYQRGKWIARNISATEESITYNMKLTLTEADINGTRAQW